MSNLFFLNDIFLNHLKIINFQNNYKKIFKIKKFLKHYDRK